MFNDVLAFFLSKLLCRIPVCQARLPANMLHAVHGGGCPVTTHRHNGVEIDAHCLNCDNVTICGAQGRWWATSRMHCGIGSCLPSLLF